MIRARMLGWLLGLAFLSVPSHGLEVSTTSVADLVINIASAPAPTSLSWPATDCSYSYLKKSGTAFTKSDPRYWLYGAAGALISAPSTLLSVPVDLASTPFRRATQVLFEIKGQIVDDSGKPLGKATVDAVASGRLRCGKDDVCCHPVLYNRFHEGTTDADGNIDLFIEASFRPNRDILVTISLPSTKDTISSFDLLQSDDGAIEVIKPLPDTKSSAKWMLIPAKDK